MYPSVPHICLKKNYKTLSSQIRKSYYVLQGKTYIYANLVNFVFV